MKWLIKECVGCCCLAIHWQRKTSIKHGWNCAGKFLAVAEVAIGERSTKSVSWKVKVTGFLLSFLFRKKATQMNSLLNFFTSIFIIFYPFNTVCFAHIHAFIFCGLWISTYFFWMFRCFPCNLTLSSEIKITKIAWQKQRQSWRTIFENVKREYAIRRYCPPESPTYMQTHSMQMDGTKPSYHQTLQIASEQKVKSQNKTFDGNIFPLQLSCIQLLRSDDAIYMQIA